MLFCAGLQQLFSEVSPLNSLALKTDFLPPSFFLFPVREKKKFLKHRKEGIVEQSQVELRDGTDSET